MASSQYDLDEATRKVIIEKAKRRAELREQCLKLKTDPFIHASGHGGNVFDPALQRYQAMHVSNPEFFKPTAKNALHGICFVVLPMVIYGYFMHRSRSNFENKVRNGEVAYKDRTFKFC